MTTIPASPRLAVWFTAIGLVMASCAVIWLFRADWSASIRSFARPSLKIALLTNLALCLLATPVHEGIHALGFLVFGRLRPREIQFGVRLRPLQLWITYRTAVALSAFRGAIALPGIILGVVPILLGIIFLRFDFVMFGVPMLAGSASDVVLLMRTLRFSGNDMILPTESGLEIIKNISSQD